MAYLYINKTLRWAEHIQLEVQKLMYSFWK